MTSYWKQLAIALAACGAVGCGGSTGGTASGDAGQDTPTAMDVEDSASSDGGAGDARADAAADRSDATDGARPDVSMGTCPVPPTPMGVSRAAAMCAKDTDCMNDALACDTDFRAGFCTAECTDSTSQACEQAQCGGTGATCLTIGEDADAISFCTNTCTPSARGAAPGTCRAGTVCTGWWYTHTNGDPDRTGCEYFCSSDANCPAGEQCNRRTGECNGAAVATRRADGSPCDPTMEGQCRGVCFQDTDDEHQGICGSLINLAVGGDCPDSPTAIHPLAPGDENGASDNLALCIYRECMSDADCTAPLRCVPGTSGDPDTCGYDDGSLPPPDAGTDAATTDAPAITDAASDAATSTDAPATTDAASDAATSTDAATATDASTAG